MERRKLNLVGLLTIVGLPLVGFIIHYYLGTGSFISIFITKSNYLIELVAGSAVGLATGFLALKLTQIPQLKPGLEKYERFTASLKVNHFTIIFVSICAGVGEEIFFRGTIQPLLGIWITSFLFVAVHGYFNPKNWSISIYATLITLVFAFIGWMTEVLGLTSAIIAHTCIDLVLLYRFATIESKATTPKHIINKDQMNESVE